MDALKINKGSPTTASSASPSSSANNASSSNANKSAASAASSNANSSTVSTNTSITVRFNASDECIDDLFQSFHHNSGASGVGGGGSGGGGGGGVGGGGSNTNLAVGGGVGGGDSLSTSPSQHQQMPLNNPDEVNTRNNFLQGNFFNRKSGLPVKQQLSPIHPCPPNQLDHGSLGGVCGGPHSSSSPIPPGIVGGGSPYNGSQAGGSSGGVSPNLIAGISPNSNAGISPNKYRRSISFPIKGANSPTPQGYGLDINAAKAAGMPTLSVGNGSMSAGASGCGDAPLFMGAGGQPYMTNGMDMRPLDHCLNDIMRGMGAVGPGGDNNVTAATIMAERMRNHKLSERHLGEIDAVAIAANNGASVYLDPTMKLNSPSRSSPHSQGSDHTARFSRKVFVGGLPPDIDEDEITSSFRRFGPLVVDWPHKAESKSYFPPKGYAFLLFQDENSVQQLIDSCITDDDKLYLCVSSPTIKDKPVQIRPWRLADADYVLDATMSLDPRKTVFVGGVPRPLKAYELAMIMNRLYGGVCYAGIDTDPELKYPKGAGRVAFSNQQSYIAAISARSGSIEGISPTSVGPNLIAALSSNDATSMGTWKMIKGKVSQTIEDIKASKSNSHTTMTPPVYPTVVIKGGHQTPVIDFDSDLETKTSVSEDLSVEHDRRSSAGSTKHKRASKLEDSDTDFENEILLEGDVEHSRLRRGLANLKSKVKAKHEAHQAKKATLSTAVGPTAIRGSMKKDISPSRSTGSSSSSTSLRGTFLRRRRQKGVEQGDLISPTNISPISALAATVVSGELAATVPVVVSGKPAKKSVKDHKKDIEIESGVEMLEDMIPPSNLSLTDDSGTSVTYYVSKRNVLDLPLTDLTGSSSSDIKVLYTNPSMNIPNITPYQSLMSITSMRIKDNAARAEIRNTVLKIFESVKNLPILSLLALMLILVLPINDFIRGVLCCLLGITIVESIWNFIQSMIEYYILTAKPEKKVFNIPDYTKMEICEVPAVEEFKTLKSYDGWMNEVDSYDPNTFHISMTRSVYVKLEGSILHISNTHARIPKRLMWNEPPIDLKTIAFTCHRSYNLLGCRIELLPIGLAKKRHFNRKYPIQLIVKPMKSKKTTDGSKSNTPKMAAKHHKSGFHKSKQEKHDTKETSDIKSTAYESTKAEAEIDFGATIMNADLQKLQDDVNPDGDLGNITVPCGDEVRILLFTRGAREKEDWYRRFIAASIGDVRDKDLQLNNVKLIDDTGLQAAATKYAQQLTNPKPKDNSQTTMKSTSTVLEHQSTTEEILDIPSQKDDIEHDFDMLDAPPDETDSIEGLLMTAGAARNDPEYVKFMALYQNSCRQTRIPVYKGDLLYNPNDTKRHKRTLRQENELWRGIDQSLFLGPSGSVVWANVLVGRVLFSSLQNANLLEKLQDILQKKLNSIKLPSFMEDVIIKSIDLGNKPPLVHRVSQPLLDERGIWFDMDVTYEGLCQITVTTKLNLLRLKRPTRQSYMQDSTFNIAAAQMNASQYSTLLHAEMSPSSSVSAYTGSLTAIAGCGPIGATVDDDVGSMEDPPFSSIFDSDAESTGSSSTESDNSLTGTLNENPNCVNESSNPGNARRIFKFVDRIATSNFFQYATELSYVQKAMENMSTTITLGIDLHGLVSRVTLNLPPPPSDRVWLAFRAPPRLWITARPTVGDKSVDWSIVTNVIEGKLCEAVNKYLVFPNMVDLTIPILGKQQSASE